MNSKPRLGFDTKQLEDFKLDRARVQQLLGVPAILIGIWSSRYRPRTWTVSVFDGALLWSTLASHFDDDPLLRRADTVFRR